MIGAAAVVRGILAVDTSAASQMGKLDEVVKHETTHADQMNADPVAYAETARTLGQFSKLETAARNSETENSVPDTQLTFDQARDHIRNAFGLPTDKPKDDEPKQTTRPPDN